MLDQVEEGRLAPVQVVEDHHDGPLGRPSLEQLAKGPRDLLRGASGGVVAEYRGERTDRLAGRDELLHDFGDRPVADPFAVGETAAADDRRVHAAEELLRESRLADARGAEDREEVARAVAGDAGERPLEQLALPLAADHSRAVTTAGGLVPHRDQPVGGEELGLALRLDRRRRFGLDAVTNQPVGLLAEQHLARLGRLLEPRGDVDRVAGRQPLLGAGDHFAGVDAHPQLEPRAVAGLELVVQLAEPVSELGGRAHGAQSVVLVHGRHAEDGHHGVADELLDGAAVPLDDRLRGLEVARHHAAQALGVDPLAERGRAGDVAEEHRHDLARLPRARSRGQHGTAGVAEACALPVLGPATRADEHETSLGRVRLPQRGLGLRVEEVQRRRVDRERQRLAARADPAGVEARAEVSRPAR